MLLMEKQIQGEEGQSIVLVARSDGKGNRATEFVTWRRKINAEGKEENFWGHYYVSLPLAVKDFQERSGS